MAISALAPPAAAAAPKPAAAVTLVDQTGHRFQLADFKGRATVVTFIATRCKDTCPISDALFAKLSRDRIPALLLTITLDPAYDTPFVMARHARDLHAQPDLWRVASGNPHDIDRLLSAFGVVRDYDRDGVPDAHSSFIYIFDAGGRLAKTLPLSTNSLAEIRAAVERAG
jgi:protein SCO1/2